MHPIILHDTNLSCLLVQNEYKMLFAKRKISCPCVAGAQINGRECLEETRASEESREERESARALSSRVLPLMRGTSMSAWYAG